MVSSTEIARRDSGSAKRYDFGRAYRAMRALIKDPNDTPRVFDIVDALPGRSLARAVRRLEASETGRRLLSERPSLAQVLADRDRLAAMAADSLAAAYLAFMQEEQITPQMLADADGAVRKGGTNPREEYVWQYIRDVHDLWHVVTGYHGDFLGEPALQAFTFAQLRMPGSGFIVFMVYLQTNSTLRGMIREGFRSGLRASWLLGEDWPGLLPLPLQEVRRRLNTRPAKPYEPMRKYA